MVGFAAMLAVAGAAGAATVGNTSQGAATLSTTGTVDGTVYQAAVGFTARTLAVYIPAGTAPAQVRGAIYSAFSPGAGLTQTGDGEGPVANASASPTPVPQPESLLGQTGVSTLTAGAWNLLALEAPVPISPGSDYFLCVFFDTAGAIGNDSVLGFGSYSFTATWPTFPGAYPGGDFYFRVKVSIYATDAVPGATATPTRTPTASVTTTPTVTPSVTRTWTPTATPTLNFTLTPTRTRTLTPSSTPNFTQTATRTVTRTSTMSPTATHTKTVTRTATPTASRTHTATVTPTSTISATISPTFTFTPSCTITLTPAPTSTATPSVTSTPLRLAGDEVVAYPAPATGPDAWFAYTVEGPSDIELEIVNVNGERCATLADRAEGAGNRRIHWRIGGVAPGVYLFRLRITSAAGTRLSAWRKLVIVKN